MAEIYDIVICPVCNGAKQVIGQVMKNKKVYEVKAHCPRCKGKGRVGMRREETHG